MHAASLSFFTGRRAVVRNIYAGLLLERFLVGGVAALLLLRFYLELTHYPQVGGNGLHIAHLLWGGLLMLVALILVFSFLGESIQALASSLGGIGFGLFIDELGKFITSDNNYFYRPAIALIYVVFVLLFVAFRAIERQQSRSDNGYLVNALSITADAVLDGFDRGNRDRAIALLDEMRSTNSLASALREALLTTDPAPDRRPGRLTAAELWLRETYAAVVQSTWFSRAVLAGFFLYAVATAVALTFIATSAMHVRLGRAMVSATGDLGFTAIADVLIIIGAIAWSRSRLKGLLWFKRSLLVSILLAQPFLFYDQQLAALFWLAFDIILLEALNYMIGEERHAELTKSSHQEA